MSETMNVDFKLNESIKKSMEEIYFKQGFSMNVASDSLEKKAAKEKGMPFDVSADLFYSESNMRHLENIVNDIKSGNARFAEHDLIEEDE